MHSAIWVSLGERFYESQRWMWWDELRRDLRYGLRSLAKTPSFTVAVVLTVALGVGVNTAVFSLIDTVLLRSLPVRDPSGLVFVLAAGSAGTPGAPPYPTFARLREQTSAFAGMAAFATDEIRVEIDGHPEPVNGQIASGDYFSVVGVKPLLGRLTESRDEKLDPPVAVISYRYWLRRFGGDPAVLGKTLSSGGRNFTIVGVTPAGFEGLRPGFAVDMTLPISQDVGDLGGHAIVARLKAGTTEGQAQAESASVLHSALFEAGVVRELIEQRFRRVELRPAGRGEDTLRGRFTRPLYALVGIAGLVLLLATANIANLLLARGFTRRREFAIRLATGASRLRLARQLVTETLLLFTCGAVPGVALARLGVTIIESLFAEGRRSITIAADLNWRVLGFAVAVTLAAGLASALFPAWRVFHSELEQVIREGQTRSSESRASFMLRQILVASQVAVSLVLLVGAISFAGTLAKLRDVDPGFRNDQVLTMSVELPEGYLKAGKSGAVWRGVAAAVRAIPEVKSASLATFTPLSQRDRWRPVAVRGYQPASEQDSLIHFDHISEGYFETLGIPMLHGRLFTSQDTEGAPRVAVINEAAARKFFAGRDAVGQVLAFDKVEYRIVGVVRDAKHNSLREPSGPFAFLPLGSAAVRARTDHADGCVRGAGRGGGIAATDPPQAGRSRLRFDDFGSDLDTPADGCHATDRALALRTSHGIRRTRDDPGIGRTVRNAQLSRGAAAPVDRHSHGAGGVAFVRDGRRAAADRIGSCGRAVVRTAVCGDGGARRGFAVVGSEARRSRDLPYGSRNTVSGRIRQRLAAGATRVSHRTRGSAAARLSAIRAAGEGGTGWRRRPAGRGACACSRRRRPRRHCRRAGGCRGGPAPSAPPRGIRRTRRGGPLWARAAGEGSTA